ncbi:related to 5-carboxyvanillate decarboxylase [Cephalotrichum gorgonifer]|uniref:Related to 5-carboxyvanillate decarboxylase n=1 Tax=Cephalotrichum gorgonifer TaxID=2041049 RepID=A0AAE8MSU1_9PEZI|nr:related to 5-carboxyvanillate decarboxylase [Cephalotrichum gorgonifer]
MAAPKGTIALEEAVVNPDDLDFLADVASMYAPGASATDSSKHHALTQKLADIHDERLRQMDAEGVEYMLLSITAPGCQGVTDPARAQSLATKSNDWLAAEVARNPARFGALASLSMHSGAEAAAELQRAVRDLGMFGALLNNYQSVGADGRGKRFYDTPDYHVFWETVQELDVPVYMHPSYPTSGDLNSPESQYGPRTHLLGAAVQFHLDLSFHLYALASSGIFDLYPRVQVVAGHLGEGIPFNLWRANHWYNKPVKRATRPSKEDYGYYFKHNISITTSGFYSTQGLKFCIGEIGVDRCMYSIDYPYDTIKEAQDWWKGLDLPEDQKVAVARQNAIRLFKLPLEL